MTTVLANVFLICALLPFLSPRPTASDVQLPAFIVGFVILLRDLAKDRFALGWVEGCFLSVGIWSFCFVLPGHDFNVRERVGIVMAFIIYYVVRKHAQRFSARMLVLAIVITFGSVVAQVLAPTLYQAVAPFVLRTVKDLSQGGRGASGPTAEPSFLAAMALGHGLLAIYYYSAGRLGRWVLLGCVALSATSLLLSKSATGFMYFGVLAAIAAIYYAFQGMTVGKWVGLLVSAAVLFGVILGPLAESRGGAILADLYNSPERVLADGSAQERVQCLTIGVLSMLRYPLGVGGGGYPAVALEMDERYEFRSVFGNVNRSNLTGILNAGGMYFTELGLVFLFFLGVVVGASLRIEVFSFLFAALALLFLMFSFSITFPLTWLLLGLAARKDFLAVRVGPIRRAA
jgi:hypothetical protein